MNPKPQIRACVNDESNLCVAEVPPGIKKSDLERFLAEKGWKTWQILEEGDTQGHLQSLINTFHLDEGRLYLVFPRHQSDDFYEEYEGFFGQKITLPPTAANVAIQAG